MRTINYESDFKLIEGFKDGSSILNAPFRFTYYTKVSRGVYVAEYNGREYVNCIPTEDGRVIVPFDSPKLGMGQLMVKREFFLNDADFADGVCNLVSVESTGITLDKGTTDDLGEIEVKIEPYYHTINTGGGGGYEPPIGGIPRTDLSQDVQASLSKADTALQESSLASYAKLSEVEKIAEGLVKKDAHTSDIQGLQSAIEEVKAKIDMYKEATIDFGTGEDTVTMAIMESGTTITKVKMKNVKTLYLSYGNVTKAEYVGGEVSLGNADFLVMTIIRTASDVDAVVGLTLK